jgi:integrative and conjugative element protein (TIGR02256 family)
MKLLLTPQVIKRLQRELRKAGRREIGGLLMGEHVGDELFRLVEISVQRSGGTDACFIRDPRDHTAELAKFFAQTGNDYARFNYLGEWHSHPSFEPIPSGTDITTMQSIVEDPEVGVNFLVLLVCRRSARGAIQATAVAFRSGTEPLAIPVALETETQDQTSTLRQRVRRFLGL